MSDMMNLLAGLQFTFEDLGEIIRQLESNLDELQEESEGQWEPPVLALTYIALIRFALQQIELVMQRSVKEAWEEIYSHESL